MPPIVEIEGDLLTSDAQILIHCCNCFHTMGAGIALQIKKKYPGAYEADCQTAYGDSRKMGGFSYFEAEDGKTIINLYAQYRFGGNEVHFCPQSFRDGLKKLKGFLKMRFINGEFPTIGVPMYVGCGLARGSWEEVRDILEEEFGGGEFQLKIVEFSPDD